MVKDVNLKYIVGQACVVLLGGIQIGMKYYLSIL